MLKCLFALVLSIGFAQTSASTFKVLSHIELALMADGISKTIQQFSTYQIRLNLPEKTKHYFNPSAGVYESSGIKRNADCVIQEGTLIKVLSHRDDGKVLLAVAVDHINESREHCRSGTFVFEVSATGPLQKLPKNLL